MAQPVSAMGRLTVQRRAYEYVHEYGLELTSVPAAIKSGVPMTLTFTIRHPGTGDLVTRFETVHEKRYHLFVVSRDMEVFEHIHPEQQKASR